MLSFNFPPVYVFKCSLKVWANPIRVFYFFQVCPASSFLKGCTVTLVAFVCFFPVCFEMCRLRSCIVCLWHLFDISPVCGFKCFLKRLHLKIYTSTDHTDCICMTFFRSTSAESSKILYETIVALVFSNMSSNYIHEKIYKHIGCICLNFQRCLFSNVSSKRLHMKIYSNTDHTDCICMTFSAVCQLSPQIACMEV